MGYVYYVINKITSNSYDQMWLVSFEVTLSVVSCAYNNRHSVKCAKKKNLKILVTLVSFSSMESNKNC